ncbi:hypothetical protein F5051DRAFT_437487 [Lentinula edodes]|nr:hypothetical protein F5051DRAFT_437487 [Lentinula edodes]
MHFNVSCLGILALAVALQPIRVYAAPHGSNVRHDSSRSLSDRDSGENNPTGTLSQDPLLFTKHHLRNAKCILKVLPLSTMYLDDAHKRSAESIVRKVAQGHKLFGAGSSELGFSWDADPVHKLAQLDMSKPIKFSVVPLSPVGSCIGNLYIVMGQKNPGKDYEAYVLHNDIDAYLPFENEERVLISKEGDPIKNNIPQNFALRIRFLNLHGQNKDDSIKKSVQDLIQHEESHDPVLTSPPSFPTDGWDFSSSSRDLTKPIHFIVEHEYVIGHPESIFDVVMSSADHRGNYVFREMVTDKNGVIYARKGDPDKNP